MSKIIQAESIGCRVPDQFQAQVHSVFRTAANFAVEGLDHLLTVIFSETMDLPQGIRLDPSANDVICQLKPNLDLICEGSIIRAAGYPYEIHLLGARKYDGSITGQAGANLVEAYRIAWDLLAKRQSEKQADLKITDLPTTLEHNLGQNRREPVVIRQLVKLVRSARSLDLDQSSEAVRSLIGLGGGLTPTGDDVLVGFLAGLRAAAGEEWVRLEWVGRLGKKLRIASGGTNDISRSYLILAAEGQFSSSLKNLAEVVYAGEPTEKVREAAEIAFQVGHTSGMDAATGMLAGLLAWEENLFRNQSISESGEGNG